jgi:hypothetical protein
MQITFDLSHVFHPNSSRVEDAEVLRFLLDTLIRINVAYLRHHPNTRPLFKSGVVYDRTDVWDSLPALYARGYGDCKSLTAARVAELHVAGVKALPTFRWKFRDDTNVGSSPKDYHILVQTLSGYEDPSKILGMGKDENAYFMR